MPGMTRRRLQLQGDPARLAGFDPCLALEQARQRLRQLRGDVELTGIEKFPPVSVRVVMLAGPAVDDEVMYEIAAVLRETLGIGAGATELPPEGEDDPVRGISGYGRTCEKCGYPDGAHSRGCPNGPS